MNNFFENWYYTVVPQKIIPKLSAKLNVINKEIIEEKNKNFNIFFYWQIIWDNSEVLNYNYIALKLWEYDYDFDKIEKVWGIKHNIIIQDKYLVFIFDKFITDKSYKDITQLLQFIYTKSEVVDFVPYWDTTFYPDNTKIEWEVKSDKYISTLEIDLLLEFFTRYNNQIIFNQETTRENIEKIIKSIKWITIESILKKLWIAYDKNTFSVQWDDKRKIDDKKNIVIDKSWTWNPIWNPFFFVLQHKNWRIDETLEWFNNNYETGFKLNTDDKSVIKSTCNTEWFIITKWDAFFLWDSWYIKTWEKTYPLTNFYIKVYYVIEKLDWKKEYIVELHNPATWETTNQVSFYNTHSKTKFKEFLSSFGWFFFYWAEPEITAIMKSITVADVPSIKNTLWLWFHWDKLILANWVFNLKTKKLTLSEKWDRFIFDDENQWYQISINNWKNFFDIFKSNDIHKFNTDNKVMLADDIWKTFGNMYKWDNWLLLLMYIYWQISFWIFKDFNDSIRYPILLSYWLTSSWKTEFVELIARVYNASWELHNFNWVTAFMFLFLISTFQWIPVFFSEYREKWIKDISTKQNRIRNLYDRKWDWKWTADQWIIWYKFISNLCIEWEETIWDAATRSRSILFHMSKKHKLDSVVEFKKLSHSDELKNLLYTYLRKVDYDYSKYNWYFLDWLKSFISSESRIDENFSRIYAWCMMFDNTKSDEYIRILKTHFELMVKDQKETQWYMTFFKAIAMNINNIITFSQDDSPFFVWDVESIEAQQYPHFFLKVWKIQEYFRTKNVPLELEFNTYLSYMADAWYDYWLHEVWDQWMMYAVKIPITKDIPKELLVIKEVFDAYKKLESKWRLL